MHFKYTPYIWPLLFSALISASLGIYALIRRRNIKYAISFSASMFIVTVWSFGNAMEILGADLPTKLFWANVQYFAYCYSPVALIILSMQFTGYDKLIKNRKALFLAVLPTVFFILVWTDGLHGLMRYNIHMVYSGALPVIAKNYGPAFYAHSIYSYLLNISAIIILIGAAFYRKTIYRKQAIALLVAASMIAFPNALYILGLSPVKQFDITPVFFGPAGLLVAWSIFKYKMLDLMPVALAAVMKSMDCGIMILDLQGRVLDTDPVFERITGISSSKAISLDGAEVCQSIPELSKACSDKNLTHVEFPKQQKGETHFYEAILSPIYDSKNTCIGRLIWMHDITDHKKTEQILLKQQRELAIKEERERITRNLHDDLGQVLGFISVQSQGVRQELVNAGVDVGLERLDKLAQTAQSAHNNIREYIQKTRNADLSGLDFVAAFKLCLERFREETGCTTRLLVTDQIDADGLEPVARFNILYILKEALNNVQKHAHAKCVTLSVTVQDAELRLSVEDDGKGFDPSQKITSRSSFGLAIMRERAADAGGTFSIESYPEKGTRLVICVPFTNGGRKS